MGSDDYIPEGLLGAEETLIWSNLPRIKPVPRWVKLTHSLTWQKRGKRALMMITLLLVGFYVWQGLVSPHKVSESVWMIGFIAISAIGSYFQPQSLSYDAVGPASFAALTDKRLVLFSGAEPKHIVTLKDIEHLSSDYVAGSPALKITTKAREVFELLSLNPAEMRARIESEMKL